MKYFFLFLISTNALAFNFKMRAREHYEVHEIYNKDKIDHYRGLTNTINLWWEKPYDTYFGLSFSPILASIKEVKEDSQYGEKITQQNIGLEFKKFLSSKLFYRLGLGHSNLETTKGAEKNFKGNYGYLGLGIEIPFDSHGLALELAYRYADYEKGIYIKTFTPSVGFHFYKSL